jgi:hypothetical protein
MSGTHSGSAQAGSQPGLDTITAVELGGMAESCLEVLELRQRAAHQIVGAAAGALEVLGKLGERPVLVEVQAARVALVLGEQGAVDVEKPLLPDTRGERLRVGCSNCQGQDLDMLPDLRESAAWAPRSRRPHAWHMT